jgi:hypothetical protein
LIGKTFNFSPGYVFLGVKFKPVLGQSLLSFPRKKGWVRVSYMDPRLAVLKEIKHLFSTPDQRFSKI